jgi:hypothetical protein
MRDRQKIKLTQEEKKKIKASSEALLDTNLKKLSTKLSDHSKDLKLIYETCRDAKLQILLSDYEKSESPLFLWDALALCLKHELPLPKQVKDYLTKCGQELSSTDTNNEKYRYQNICESIGFKGGDTFSAYSRTTEKRFFVVAYYCLFILHITQEDLPEKKYDRDILKKSIRKTTSKGLKLSVTSDRTLRNWINEHDIQRPDILSYFTDNDNLLTSHFPEIPAMLPIVVHQNFKQFKDIIHNI